MQAKHHPQKSKSLILIWQVAKVMNIIEGGTHKDVSSTSITRYLNYDHVGYDKINRLRKKEEKILSSATTVAANIVTLIYHLVYGYVGRTI